MDLHVFPIPIPPPISLSTRSLWVFPVHQVLALVSCIQPGLVICFTLDNIYVSMLFSQNIPSSPSPTEFKSRVFSNELALHISFSLSPSNEYSRLVSFRIDWFDVLAKGLSRVFSNTTVQSTNSSVLSLFYCPTLRAIHDYWKNHRFD